MRNHEPPCYRIADPRFPGDVSKHVLHDDGHLGPYSERPRSAPAAQQDNLIITDLVAICFLEPDASSGLDGFSRGEVYRCQKIEGDSPPHYRVFNGPPDAYACAVPRVFFRFFRTETAGMHILLTTHQSRSSTK